MPHRLDDLVRETSVTTGTGSFTLAGAVAGRRAFADVLSTGDTVPYVIRLQGGTEWEIGRGTFTSPSTLARTSVRFSSNANAAVNFSAGTKDVYVDLDSISIPFIVESATTRAVQARDQVALGSTAGNARGTGAVDLQARRTAATQVASGNYATIVGGFTNTASGTASFIGGGSGHTASGNNAVVVGGQGNSASTRSTVVGGLGNTATAAAKAFIGGGYYNTASGTGSVVVGGQSNTASGTYSTIPGGFRAVASKFGQWAYASGRFAADGDAQISTYVLRNSTTDATQTELFLNGSSARLTLANDTTYAFTVLIASRRTDADGESAAYLFQGCIDRQTNAASTALVGTVTKTVLAEDNAAWDADVDADTTNGSLRIRVTAEAAKAVRHVAFVQTVEVTG